MITAIYHHKVYDHNTGLISNGYKRVAVIDETERSYLIKFPKTNTVKWVRKYNVKVDPTPPDNIRLPYKD